MTSLAFRRATLAVLTAALMGGCAINPEPLTPEFLAANAADKTERVIGDQEPVSGTIDLHEAMARALKYNLDHKVEQQETALRVAELDLAHYNLLPNAIANSGYSDRSNVAGSSSYNLLTRSQNFGFSTSQDEEQRTNDLTFSWHVLDFGLSYVRAQQAADKALIANESRRKVVHRLMEDVRTSYSRAYSAQKLVTRLRRLEIRTKAAIAGSRTLSDDRVTSPITAITYRRELIEIQRTLQELQRELAVAKVQLAALMNVKPGSKFSLAAPHSKGIPAVPTDMDGLVQTALENRPELRDVAYRQRINAQEAHAALLEMLPGIQLFAGGNMDSNSFLLNNNWLGWGAKASWNLMKVFQYPAQTAVIDHQDKLLDQRALALTMAIMTQIYVSEARLVFFKRELATANTYNNTQQELVGHIRAEHAANQISEQTLLREELNAAVAELKLDIARASLQTGYANLIAALGLDPAPEISPDQVSVGELANALRLSGPISIVRIAQSK